LGLSVDAWAGVGRSVSPAYVLDDWTRVKMDLKKQTQDVTLGLGTGVDHSASRCSPDVHVVLEYKLW